MFDGGNLLVLAGAGTGKTRVLTSRFSWLVGQDMASSGEILAVTFTNKAAEEMKVRVAALLGREVYGAWIGTFHSVANRLLRRHAGEAGLRSGFQIIDKADQTAVARRVLEQDRGEKPAKEDVRELSGFIAGCKEQGHAPAAVAPSDYKSRKWLPYYELYEKLLQEENKVDFGGLMMRSYELLAGQEGIRRQYAERFRHVLVDEFQDTSRFQYSWLKLFRGGGNRFFVVGDDDQSVYGFRAADPGIMQTFRGEFEVPEVARLEVNYRSQPHILTAANSLIACNANRIGKMLRPHAGAPKPLRLRAFCSGEEEADSVVAALEENADAGDGLDTAAIIYRTNAQSRLFEQRLASRCVPYRIYGGQRFFDRKEVKDALAYLRLAADPQDREALRRVVNFPPRKIGAVTERRLFDHPGGPWAGVEQMSESSRNVAQFRRTIEALARAFADGASPSALTELVNSEAGLYEHYRRSRDDLERLENLQELVSAAKQFEREHREEETVADFISYASLDTGKASLREGGGVNLMTAHAAKGLEFGIVFIVGVEDAFFPHKMSADDPEKVEEERRLMYVAITRAKRVLQLSYAHSRMEYGRPERRRPSRFLDEIPDEVLDRPRPRPDAAGSLQSRSSAARSRWGGNASAYAFAKPQGASEGAGYRRGDMVRHPKFGSGVVMSVQSGANGPLVEVYFKSSGRKKIDTSIVPLR